MRFYLKEYPDGGWEYSGVGREIEQEKLDAGFQIVDTIPQRIKDKEPGGKDYVEPKPEMQQKIEELEQRIAELETKQIEAGTKR